MIHKESWYREANDARRFEEILQILRRKWDGKQYNDSEWQRLERELGIIAGRLQLGERANAAINIYKTLFDLYFGGGVSQEQVELIIDAATHQELPTIHNAQVAENMLDAAERYGMTAGWPDSAINFVFRLAARVGRLPRIRGKYLAQSPVPIPIKVHLTHFRTNMPDPEGYGGRDYYEDLFRQEADGQLGSDAGRWYRYNYGGDDWNVDDIELRDGNKVYMLGYGSVQWVTDIDEDDEDEDYQDLAEMDILQGYGYSTHEDITEVEVEDGHVMATLDIGFEFLVDGEGNSQQTEEKKVIDLRELLKMPLKQGMDYDFYIVNSEESVEDEEGREDVVRDTTYLTIEDSFEPGDAQQVKKWLWGEDR